MLIWFLITEEARQGLVRLQDRLFPYVALCPPLEEEYGTHLTGKIEGLEEIEKEMKKKPRGRVKA